MTSENKINKYHDSKIYRIVCFLTGYVYIGSTCEKYLSTRLAGHKSAYKNYLKNKNKAKFTTSFKVLEKNSFRIELIEEVHCNNINELRRIEGKYIQNEECVNKLVPGLNNEDRKVIRLRNQNEIDVITNKIKVLNQLKQTTMNKKDLTNLSKQIYNKTFSCICGVKYTIGPLKYEKHINSNKHLKYISVFELY